MRSFRPALLVLACVFAQPALAFNLPSLGDSSSSIISPEQEHQLGRAWLSVLRGQVRQLEDPLLKDYVETSVYRLAESSQLNDRRLEFIILAFNPEVSARHVIGDPIIPVIYSSLIIPLVNVGNKLFDSSGSKIPFVLG